MGLNRMQSNVLKLTTILKFLFKFYHLFGKKLKRFTLLQ